MINGPAIDTTGVRALAAAVRDGELTPEQRTALVGLLSNVDAAALLAPRVRECYPDGDALAVGYLIGNWAPVQQAYVELAATVRPGGEGHAA